MRGATRLWDKAMDAVNFNPRSPCGERQDVVDVSAGTYEISIHAPHAGSDGFNYAKSTVDPISIHAPHAGSDWMIQTDKFLSTYFNPRSPCGERL